MISAFRFKIMYNVIYLGKFNCINMGFDKTGNKRIEIKKISFRSKSFFGGYSHMCPPYISQIISPSSL